MISAIKQKLSAQAGKAVANAGWVFADRIFRMAAGLLVGIWVARYLGPEQFGLLNYAAVFPIVLLSVANLGLTSQLLTELVRKQPYSGHEILGTGFALKFVAGIVAFSTVAALGFVLHSDQPVMRWMIFLSSFTLLFQSVDVIDLFFQSEVRARQSVIAKTLALLVVTSLRVLLLLQQSSLLAFSFLLLLEGALTALAMILLYHQETGQHVRHWRFNRSLARYLLRSSWPVMVSEFFIFVYMRVNLFMLGQLASSTELGKFSAALRLSELWYFVAIATTTSFYPLIVSLQAKDPAAFVKKYQELLSLLTLVSLVIALLTTVFAQTVVSTLYGTGYRGTAQVLTIHIWSGLFVFLGVGSSNWFVLHGLQRFLLYKTVAGALLNVVLNAWLIPAYGATGASVATLFSYLVSAYGMNYVFDQTRNVFWMQTAALADAFRLTTLKNLWQRFN